VPGLVGQHVPGHLRVGDDHPGHRAEPEKARLLPVLPHVPAEARGAMSWHRSGRGVDHASLFILPEVARQEAVRRATPRAPAAGNATTAGAADGRHATGASGPP